MGPNGSVHHMLASLNGKKLNMSEMLTVRRIACLALATCLLTGVLSAPAMYRSDGEVLASVVGGGYCKETCKKHTDGCGGGCDGNCTEADNGAHCGKEGVTESWYCGPVVPGGGGCDLTTTITLDTNATQCECADEVCGSTTGSTSCWVKKDCDTTE